MWQRVQAIVWLNGLNFLIVSHHFAKFGGHRLCGGSDTTAKIIYKTLQDHMIKGYGDFVEGNSSLYFPTLPKLVAIDIVLIDIWLFWFVICYKTTWLYGPVTLSVEVT